MADQKITQLNENTAPVAADLLVIVDDPAGSPETQKITVDNLFENIPGNASLAGFLTLEYAGELTISSGAVTATGSYHLIDTESDAASDDLDTINGNAVGRILILKSVNNLRDVTYKDGTGNLKLEGDFVATNVDDSIMLLGTSTGWVEISRSNNA